jgi:alpha-mannosidase
MFHQQRLTLKKVVQRLKLIQPLIFRRSLPLPPFLYQQAADNFGSPAVLPEMDDNNWVVLEPESYWGNWNKQFILQTSFQVPADWPDTPAVLYLPLGESGEFSHPEALVYLDGQPYSGCDRHHQEVVLSPSWCDNQTHKLTLAGWTGRGTERQTQLLMRRCFLRLIDPPTRYFVALARVALGVAVEIEDHQQALGRLLNALDSAICALDTREPFGERFYDSVPAALALLQTGVSAAGPPLDVCMTAAGHAHIDVAWLWTLAQTRQ